VRTPAQETTTTVPPKVIILTNQTNHDPSNVNHVYARDRAAVVTCAILAILRDALNDPQLRSNIASTLRFEFADLERQVLSENRPAD
jgi:hypothetical protein